MCKLWNLIILYAIFVNNNNIQYYDYTNYYVFYKMYFQFTIVCHLLRRTNKTNYRLNNNVRLETVFKKMTLIHIFIDRIKQ